MKLLRFIFLTFLVAQSSISVTEGKSKSYKASTKPACDANAVTRNCDFFRERSDQANIQLPDGGILTNPLYDPARDQTNQNNPSVGNPPSSANVYIQGVFDYHKTISNQAEIIDVLDDTDLSTRFK